MPELQRFSSNGVLDADDIETTFKKKDNGCYVKITTGFILVFLALILSLGVGLIVHFVEKENGKTDVSNGDSSSPLTSAKLTEKCRDMASSKDFSQICNVCPTALPTSTETIKHSDQGDTTPPSASRPTTAPKVDVRLPKALEPLKYEVEILPDLYGDDAEKFTFTGKVKILMKCVESTNTITIHGHMLQIDEASINFKPHVPDSSSDDVKLVSFKEDKVLQFLIFELSDNLLVDKSYILEVNFNGPLKTDLKGLYLSSYEEDGLTKYLATTQFQPTDARKAFPCFDEPDFKANFTVVLVRKKSWISLSNLNINRTERRDDDYMADIFNESPPMSTYLIAFVVCQFQNLGKNTSNGLQIFLGGLEPDRIYQDKFVICQFHTWAKPESVHETREALEVGTKIIEFYEKFFGINYPLPKQDMIAIPDYPLGAMENWGLITYRESRLLYDASVSSERDKESVTLTVVHELAHQWFGNLVTMGWWDDLWLNEGFATFMEYFGTSQIHPDWKSFEYFTIYEFFSALEMDGLSTSHPIYVPVSNPDEINEIFDAISYNKGGSIVRMMRFLMGEDTFLSGIQEYLRSRSYKTSSHNDLWNALEQASKKDNKILPKTIKEIMDTWILQMNYPVVTVTHAEQGKLHVEQKRFLVGADSSGNKRFHSPFNYTWNIPFTYTTSKELNFKKTDRDVQWITGKVLDISDNNLPDITEMDSFIIGNTGQYGFYRVNYSKQNWMAIMKQFRVNHKGISVVNRGQIINDAWNLAKAGELDMSIALQSVEYMDKEMDYVPWVAATRELSYMSRMLSKTELYGDFRNFMTSKVESPFQKLTLDDTNSTHLETYLRTKIASVACDYGVPACVTEAKKMFQDWMDDPDNYHIDPDVKSTVYCTGIAEGGVVAWDFAYKQYKQSHSASEKMLLLSALGCAKETWILNRYLDFSMDPKEVRKQDQVSVIETVSSSVIGRSLAWDFVRANWDYLRQSFGSGFFSFSRMILSITESFNTPYDLIQLQQFVSTHEDLGTGKRAFDQAIERTESNINWLKKNKAVIKEWLDRQSKPSDAITDVRLPRSVIPSLYEIEILPDIYRSNPEDFKIIGRVRISILCKMSTTNITLHTNKLVIDDMSVRLSSKASNGLSPCFVRQSEDLERQFLILHLDSSLVPEQEYVVEMNFTGPLKDDLAGLYYSSYRRGEEVVYMAVTQLESTDARKAFPCFDEPDFKAKFQITLLRKTNKISLSNMPVDHQETRSNGYVADVYKVSEKMSTYLVCIVICDFKSIKGTTKNNIIYGAWARPESVKQAQLALEVGMETISFYEDFFEIKFPLPKQDMIAIPDFSAGAMENWGLITYRETAMLFEPGVSSESNKQRVTTVITHELAHQWFGDLVTMKWWDDLWLNEGFATFVQYVGADHKFPDWKMFEQFSINEIQSAFDFDCLVTSHPIYAPVANPDEINEIFDSISYAKGASIIRMMKFFTGDSTFRHGLKKYLTQQKFGNAVHGDLWNAMNDQAIIDGGKRRTDVNKIMDTWTLQMNYPVVHVSVDSTGKMHVSQKRYLRNPSAKDPQKYTSPFGYVWTIPFTYTLKSSAHYNQTFNDIVWINETKSVLPLRDSIQPGDWIIGNVQQFGYYRVNYDRNNWLLLIKQLKSNHKKIHVINRGQIINDAWALAKSGDLDMNIALNVIEYLGKEMDYVPWYAAKKEISYVYKMLSRTAVFGKFKKFMKSLVQAPFERYGMTNENGQGHIESYTQTLLMGQACSYGIDECNQEAVKIFRDWMLDPINNRVNPDIASTVYCSGISEGGEEEWNFVYNQYKMSGVASEKATMMSALACTKQTWLLSRYLEMSINASEIRRQDGYKVIISVSRNSVGRDLTWNFVKANFDTLLDMYSTSSFSLKNLLNGISDSLNTPYDLQQLKAFQVLYPDMGTGTRAFQQVLEKTESNIEWMKRYYGIVEAWLNEKLESPKEVLNVRLPRAVLPYFYTLELYPDIYQSDPENFTFTGTVRIDVRVMESTDNITLHVNKLMVDSKSVRVGREDNVVTPGVGDITEDKERQFLIISMQGLLEKGHKYWVEMNYTGALKNDLTGLYWSSYKRGDDTVYIATTQMEPTDARKSLPCFDEPDLKAKFKITLIRKKDKISLSNMPIEKTVTRSDGLIADIYETSETMSTYLLCFIICDFNKTTGITKNGTRYSAWARPESIQQTRLALDVGIDTLTFYEEFFGISYPIPKQDMIAIPDFAAGAMENWGLITYRETAMLYEPGVSSESNKQGVTVTITHELGHQWFGNLVTMQWWDDLWLNEGFAAFLEYLGADKKFPDWKMFDQFIVYEIHSAFNFDGLVTSHPIYVPVQNPDQINEIFDSISYAKGASVIRMMRFFLGEETFQKGLNRYLKYREFGNAFHNDLWIAMTNQSIDDGHMVDVKAVMDTWTLQMNYPVVKVTLLPSGKLQINQKRFLINPNAKDPEKYVSPFGYKWKIPFTYTSDKEASFDKTYKDVVWINDTDTEIMPTIQLGNWLIANTKVYGYYRVNYDENNWLALQKQLKADHTVISRLNRAQLINDVWALARSEELPMETALKTLEYLGEEMDYVPWIAASQELNYLDTMLERSSLYGKFQNYMKSLLQKPFSVLGLDNEGSDHITILLRTRIANLACAYEIESCSQKITEIFNKWMEDPVNYRVDPNLKSLVYCTGIQQGGEAEWDFAYEQYKRSNVAAEKRTILSALSCTKEVWLLNRYLERSSDTKEVRGQDAVRVIVYVSKNPIGRDLAWDFVDSKWDRFQEERGAGSFSFSGLISGLSSSFNTEQDLEKLQKFKEDHPKLGTGATAFRQALEKTESNIQWMTKNYPIIEKWLNGNPTSNVEHEKNIRLPRSLLPEKYDIELFPDIYQDSPKNFSIHGYVKIEMTCVQDTTNITLNVNQLVVDKDTVVVSLVSGTSGGEPRFSRMSEDKELQFLILHLDGSLKKGNNYSVVMNFTGPLKDDLAGLYWSSYKRGNDTFYLAATQMESTDARKAFPCFDEPDMKATFKVTLIRHTSMKSLSNMPIIKEESRGNDLVADIHDISPRMSTYLLAFIVGDFRNNTKKTKDNITYSAWSIPDVVNQTKFALDVGIKVITFYEEYFKIPFPLPKQDMIGLPDFRPGAMENWGLITYRENLMLYKPGTSSEADKQLVAVVVAHELAHQWFGNLVTMEWWDDIWLNEGFASFVEHLGTDHIFPDWKMFEQIVLSLHNVFTLDGLVTSHPVYIPVESIEKLHEVFDIISYQKGGCVIRMMRFFLGEETFRNGLNRYLLSKKYQNAYHDDLWSSLDEQSHIENNTLPSSVTQIMNTWILQMNYPVVMVTVTNSSTIRVTQNRFLRNPEAKDPGTYISPYGYKWWVPFTYTTSNHKNFNQTNKDIRWFNNTSHDITDSSITSVVRNPDFWVIGNVMQYGIYVVNYTEQNWNALIKQLKQDHTVIHPINRAQIIDDGWNLAKANQLNMDIALRIVDYLSKEREFIPIKTGYAELQYLDNMLSTSQYYGKFKSLMQNIVKDIYSKLGLNDTDAGHLESYTRSVVADTACTYGIPECVTEAKRQFKQWMDNPGTNKIVPGLKQTIYCTAIREGGKKEWDFAYHQYKTSPIATERAVTLGALSCTKVPWLLQRFLVYAITPTEVRKQDGNTVLASVASNTIGRPITWNFVQENWEYIVKDYSEGQWYMGGVLKTLSDVYNTDYQLQELKDFGRQHIDLGRGTKTAYEQQIEKVETNIQWAKKNMEIVINWLKQH